MAGFQVAHFSFRVVLAHRRYHEWLTCLNRTEPLFMFLANTCAFPATTSHNVCCEQRLQGGPRQGQTNTAKLLCVKNTEQIFFLFTI